VIISGSANFIAIQVAIQVAVVSPGCRLLEEALMGYSILGNTVALTFIKGESVQGTDMGEL
jgi:hypothetical protein